MTSHPCLAGAPCSCHHAGPSTQRRTTTSTNSTTTANRTAPALLLAALVTPAFAVPAPVPRPDLSFLYPALARRVTDAGQAPDDPTTFSPQQIEVDDLVRAGLSLKYVFDPSANLVPDPDASVPSVDVEVGGTSGAWVVEDYWELHGKRFGPLSASATADITDDPLSTPTPPPPPPPPTPTSTTASTTKSATHSPSVLAIESSLPTGWGDKYGRSSMYPIPIIISFSIVIALMIGSLIGALVYRRGRQRKRRNKKELMAQGGDLSDGEESLSEKVVRRGLAARVGRVIRARGTSARQRTPIRHHTAEDLPTLDVEQGEEEQERTREMSERNDLERRVKSWARRSTVWRAQARLGMRRRMPKGGKRGLNDNDNTDNEATHTHADPDPLSQAITRPTSPAASESRSRRSAEGNQSAGVVAGETDTAPLAPTYASPTVPNYSVGSQPGPSTSTLTQAGGDGVRGGGEHDAHPDATPGDEPAYDYGAGLPPAYMRGEGRAEVRRGKMPMRSSTASSLEGVREEESRTGGGDERQREWSALDAYAFGADAAHGEEREGPGGVDSVTAHVATDDKRVLERLRGMGGAPRVEGAVEGAVAPAEEDVFDVPREIRGGEASGSSPRSANAPVFLSPSILSTLPPPPASVVSGLFPPPASGVLPPPPAKLGAGPVARYGEADLSLPRYLDATGEEGLGVGVPSAPPVEVLGASAPPEEDEEVVGASAPPEMDVLQASAPPGEEMEASAPPAELLAPSAPPFEDEDSHPLRDDPDTHPRLQHANSSVPLLDDAEDR